jgi:hypothetical protein
MEILVGCDPELFMKKNDKFVSAWNKIPGTKENPFEVSNGAVQVDGMALEFNIKPASNLQEFLHNTTSVMQTLKDMVPDFEVVISSTAIFSDAHFKAQPRAAKELGCEPDYSAWSMSVNPRPNANTTMRTASGHIHLGWTEDQDIYADHFETCGKVIRELDYYLGLPSLSWDSDNTRRQLYGQAGAFRPKSYGVEYRVLSNAWLNSDSLKSTVYNNAVLGVNNTLKGVSLVEEFGDLAQVILNNNILDWKEQFPELNFRMDELLKQAA